jgi:O-6-methylguanine DNA methyltransferase
MKPNDYHIQGNSFGRIVAAAVLCHTGTMLEWCDWAEPGGLTFRLTAAGQGLRAIDLRPGAAPEGRPNSNHPILAETARQLRAYFAGGLREFSLPLDLQGTEFQLRVWRALLLIPYGATESYRNIAVSIGCSNAVRAVGAANGANPIPIVVPCHRVIGSSGKLVGYGGGLPLKKRLLEMEHVAMTPQGQLFSLENQSLTADKKRAQAASQLR